MFGTLRDAQLFLLGSVLLGTDTHPLLLFTCQVTLSEQWFLPLVQHVLFFFFLFFSETNGDSRQKINLPLVFFYFSDVFEPSQIEQQKTKHNKKEDNDKIVHSQTSLFWVWHRADHPSETSTALSPTLWDWQGVGREGARWWKRCLRNCPLLATGPSMKVDASLWVMYSSTQQKR